MSAEKIEQVIGLMRRERYRFSPVGLEAFTGGPFLDVGTGLPTSPNTYEVAQAGHPAARVVYIFRKPVQR